MESLFDDLTRQLGGRTLETIGGQLGADRATTERAVPAALGTLMGALAGNTTRSGGAESLLGALDRDHDGSILDDLPGFVGRGEQGPGEGILKHVLGNNRPAVEAGLSQQTGLDASSMSRLLTLLAPVVLGALGKAKRERGLDAGSLTEMLGTERTRVAQTAPDGLGVLGGLLDRDGDGQVADDVAKIGGGLLKSFLKGRR